MNTVDAMIGGAEKAGTTSLGAYLGQHPKILSHFDSERSPGKNEFAVFDRERSDRGAGFEETFLDYFGRPAAPDELVLAKYVRLLHVPHVAEALRNHNPSCKLIFILRNPVDRAYSSFWYQRWRGAEDAQSFEEAVQKEQLRSREGEWAPHRMYLGKGRYIDHLQRLADMFGREQLYVLLLDDLKQDPQEAVDGVCAFLALDSYALVGVERRNQAKQPRWPWLARLFQRDRLAKSVFRRVVPGSWRRKALWWLRSVNTRALERPPMKSSTRRELIEYFRPYNERLAAFIDRDLSSWHQMTAGSD